MSRDPNYFRIGLFVFIGSGILVAALILFGIGQFFKPKAFLETYVDGTVQGIEVGSPVKFRGVTIGKVTTVGFLYTMYPSMDRKLISNYVVLVLELNEPVTPDMFQEDLWTVVQNAVERGLRAKIEPQGITGLNYVEIDYVEESRQRPIEVTWKPRHPYLPYAPGELTNMLDSVNNIMREIEQLNLQGISSGMVALLDNLNKAVDDANIDKLSASAQALFAEVSAAIDAADLAKLSEESQNLLRELATSNNELQEVLGNLEPASRLNADDIAATLSNLRLLTDNMRSLSGELARDPSQMIFSRPPAPSDVMDSEPVERRKR